MDLKKKELHIILQKSLDNASEKRNLVLNNPKLLKAKIDLKTFQINRLKSTHSDLAQNPGTKDATEFFLNELYGFKDLRKRDKEAAKLIPLIVKMFPTETLKVITDSFVLDSLTEDLETEMAQNLVNDNITLESLTDELYWKYYLKNSTKEERLLQLNYVRDIGYELCSITRFPLIEQVLKMMRLPAKLANLTEIHNFLEHGFFTFKKTKDPEKFIDSIYYRELAIINNAFFSQ